MSGPKQLAMLTFGPMIDNQMSHLLLCRSAQPNREQRHIFGWASVLAVLHGGTGQIPLIYGNRLKMTGPRAVIDHFETCCDPGQILIPAREPLRTQVEADWASFNGELAAYTAKSAH